MNKFYFFFIIIILCSCNPYFKQYQILNKNLPKSKFYSKQNDLIKPLLAKEKNPCVLIVVWNKSILSNDNMTFKALVYNYNQKKWQAFKTKKENPKKILFSNIEDKNFEELKYVLKNYLDGNVDYLLTLQDSFSSSEMNSPYFIYDFLKNKKIKLKSFVFDNEGKLIQ